MELPPGPAYLLRQLPSLTLPSIVTYFALKAASDHFNFVIPLWLLVVASVAVKPLLFKINWEYQKIANRRKAKALGAVLPPHVNESAWGVMKKALHTLKFGYPGELMAEWSQTYGYTFTIDRLTSRSYTTADPDCIKALLATQFDAFDKGPTFFGQLKSLLGTGVFNADGEMWKFHRSMTRPFFTRERISDFEIYDKNCGIALDQAQARLNEGFSVEFQDLLGRFTLDSATSFLFGHNVDSLSAGLPYPPFAAERNSSSFAAHPSNRFVSAFGEGLLLSAARTTLASDWPLFEFWKDKVKPVRRVLDEFTEPLLREALSKEKVDKNTEDLNLLSHLIKHTQDPQVIKDELINLLVAGRDTTMCLLSFCMYMLAEHPDIAKRLREEIIEKVGPKDKPTYQSMKEMRFMRAFLNEVLRMYPPVPLNMRTTNKPVLIPSKNPSQPPIYVPANTLWVYGVINLHRREDLWGPTALHFDPDRFLDERLHRYLTPNPYIFCPFNAGPRICLGQQFAYHEASYFLVRVLQRFTDFELDQSLNEPPPQEWKNASGTKPWEKVRPASHLTMYVKGGLWLRMKELKQR